MLDDYARTALQQLADRGCYRHLRAREDALAGRHIRINGTQLLNFSSNDYLGLADDPRLAAALVDGVRQYGFGSGASHLVSGHSVAHQQLAAAVAKARGYPAALTFHSGYTANISVLQALVSRHDVVIADKYIHASLLDGARLSGATCLRYRHNDMRHLAQILAGQRQRRPQARLLIVSESVFSMDGDSADIATIVALAKQYDAWTLIDDAHAFGVFMMDNALLSPTPDVRICTFGKALGCVGAAVTASSACVDLLINTARAYIYTTATPAALAYVARVALDIAIAADDLRAKLRRLIERFHQQLRQYRLPVPASVTPIQPLIVGDAAKAVAISERLYADGLFVAAIRPPTVATGSARLRITITAAHSDNDIDTLTVALANAWQ